MVKFVLIVVPLVCLLSSLCGRSNALDSSLTFTNANWTEMLKDEWLVKFYAPWCPACRHLESSWESLSKWSEDKGYKIGGIDVTEESGLSGRFVITSLPTVYHVKNGEFRLYSEARTLEDFQSFLSDEKWKELDPMSHWKSPSSYLMSFISKLFEVSMQLKDLHTSLTDAYGLPVWASFVIFGVVIIIFGLLLGMAMVLLSDYIFGPPCPPSFPSMEEITDDGSTTPVSGIKEQTSEVGGDISAEEANSDSHVEKEREETGVRKRTKKPAYAE